MKRLLFVLLVSCSSGDFDPPSRVVDLRLLAVRADLPYAAPGAKVHLDALAVDPTSGAVTLRWATCVDPPSDRPEDCVPDPSTLLTGPSFDLVVPPDAIARLPEGGHARASVGVVVTANDALVGVKRVFVRAADRNANPAILGVTWDGADWPEADVKEVAGCDSGGSVFEACDAALAHEVSVLVDPPESGVDEFGHTFAETVVVQYYATEGIFEHEVRVASDAKTGWVARRAASGKTVTMWLVVRDDRGGVAWATRQVRVN
jgi:hypothetical protein